jgi:hypothetical protein
MKNPANSGPFSTVSAKCQNSRLGGGGSSRSEPFSKTKFPANRENNREFRGFSAQRGFPTAKNPCPSITFVENPYSD